MKKLLLSVALIAGLGTLASASAAGVDGTITYNGAISSVTCSVHGGTPGNNSGDFTVTLPTVGTSAFSGQGDVAGATPYNIYVGSAGETGCTNGTNVNVYYEPTSPRIDPVTGFLALDPDAGVATGVELQLLNGNDKSPIDLASDSRSTQMTVSGNQAVLPFYAQYVATASSVTAGPANSSVLYSIQYN